MKSMRHMMLPLALALLIVWVSAASSEAASPVVYDETTTEAPARDTLSSVSPADSASIDSSSVVIDSLYYTCDSLYTDVQGEGITLSGAANIKYDTATIDADTIKIDMKRDQASSSGRVELKDGSYLMLGDALRYDIERQEALVKQGATRFETGFFYGDEIRKVGDETYDIDEGYFTTCDAAHPDYYIWSKKMRIYRDNMLVARPSVFFVNHFPVLALPFGAISIKRGRQTGLLMPEPGYNSHDGKYVEDIAYFIALSDYADATVGLDWKEKTGWLASLEGLYKKQYVLDGYLLAQLQQYPYGVGETREDWSVISRHRQNIGYASKLDANLHFVSSRAIYEGSADTDERLSESVTSDIAYHTPLFSRDLNVTASYSENLRTNVKSMTLPSVSYSMGSRPIYELFVNDDDEDPEDDGKSDDDAKKSDDSVDAWWRDFSYSASFKAVHTGDVTDPDANWRDILYRSTRDTTGAFVNRHHAGARQTLDLTWSRKMQGWLNLSQTVYTGYVVHDRDMNGDKFPFGYDWSTRTGAKFSLYGVRDFGGGLLLAARHVMTPSVSFTYQPDFSHVNDDFYNITNANVNDSKRKRSFSFSLENAWDLKLREDDGERKLNNFIKLTSTLPFNLEAAGKRFGAIRHNARFNPGDLETPVVDIDLGQTLTATQDAYDFDINYWALSTTLNLSGEADYTEYFPREPNRFQTSRFMEADTLETDDDGALTIDKLEKQAETDGWTLDFTHNYSRYKGHDDPSQHSLRSSLTLRLTRNWYLSYSHQYNFLDDRTVNQNLSVTRTLHCWKLTFSWTKSGDYWNYSLRLFAIKLPDALQFRTSDHKR